MRRHRQILEAPLRGSASIYSGQSWNSSSQDIYPFPVEVIRLLSLVCALNLALLRVSVAGFLVRLICVEGEL
jgi:hypothetical protein